MKLSWSVMLTLLAGCSLVRSSSDFMVGDAGPGDAQAPDTGLDADGGPDAGPECVVPGDCEPFPFAQPACSGGECVLGACATNRASCNLNPDTGCETPLGTPSNCSECGDACEEGFLCDTTGASPVCSANCGGTVCPDPAMPDDEVCVDTTMSPMHCNGCGMACDVPDGALEALCAAGECDFTCRTGRLDCDDLPANGCEVDETTDLMNCGACDNACTAANATPACQSGMCAVGSCDAGFGNCDMNPANGCEVDTESDAENCGGCGVACDSGIACVNGACDPYTDISIGATHSCAVRSSGFVDCWGSNQSFQIRSSGQAPVERPTRIQVPNAMGIDVDFVGRGVAVGDRHTSVIDSSGRLWSVGSNSELQLGIPLTTVDRLMRVQSSDPSFADSDFVRIEGQSLHTCAIDTVGDLWCWGYALEGQTGQFDGAGMVERPPTAEQVPLPRPVIDVAVSGNATCAVLDTGRVSCFGRNGNAELGRGTVTSGANQPAEVILGAGPGLLSSVVRIVSSLRAFCAIVTDGRLFCWGDNTQRALTSAGGNITGAVEVAAGVTQAWMNRLSLCWQDVSGSFCRGRQFEGQFGNGSVAAITGSNIGVAHLDGVENTRTGLFSSCGFRDGELVCWGESFQGVIPRDSMSEEVPAPVVDLDGALATDIVSLSMNIDGSCGVRGNQAFCWGTGSTSQSGNGTNLSYPSAETPVNVDDAIAVGRANTAACAIRSDAGTNALWCWGVNTDNVLGDAGGSSGNPRVIPAVPNPIAIEGGVAHFCAISGAGALSTSGQVYCWGSNQQLQTGINGGDAIVPTPVGLGSTGTPLIDDAVALTAGTDFTCALRVSGQVVCWGSNTSGQLGRGTTGSPEYAANAMVPLSTSIEAGHDHACAVTSAGNVMCWGSGDEGQLGDGLNMDSAVPVQVGGINGMGVIGEGGEDGVSVAAGEFFSCAAYDDGRARCWGRGNRYQLGNDSTSNSALPTLVTGITNAQRIIAASLRGHSACATLATGAHSCWGLNNASHLSTDPTHAFFTPTEVTR